MSERGRGSGAREKFVSALFVGLANSDAITRALYREMDSVELAGVVDQSAEARRSDCARVLGPGRSKAIEDLQGAVDAASVAVPYGGNNAEGWLAA